MRLVSFEVEGFRNFVAPVRLTELGPVNVLHGENNVGKSNVLAAIEVFFKLLGWAPFGGATTIEVETLRGSQIRREDLFDYAGARPITMHAELSLDDDDRAFLPAQPLTDLRGLTIHLTASPAPARGSAIELRLTKISPTTGADLLTIPRTPIEQAQLTQLTGALRDRFEGPTTSPRPRVDAEQRRQQVVNALYDAQVSSDRREAMQWDRFAEAMTGFSDILGEGRFLPVLARAAQATPQLFFETPRMRVPLRALGSGLQRVVELLGTVLTSGGPIVLVEEPEMHLRWVLQERMREVLAAMVGKPGAPSQLILTSHSGAFEFGDHFYWMKKGDPGPTIERLPIAMAPQIVGRVGEQLVGEIPDVPTRVSTEGVLRMPKRILKAIGVPHGGGVSFVDKGDGVAEVMSDDTFLRRAGLGDDDA